MKFYSGFALTNEQEYFKDYIDDTDFCVCGFSYGAIKALRYTFAELQNTKRVDRLQLLSPAFFQTKDEKFKKVQLMGYRKNAHTYLEQFLKSCFAPYGQKDVTLANNSIDELKELLEYIWDKKELEYIKNSGVKIEVYLGGNDNIIDAKGAKEFFLEFATVTYIKDANHFLQIN